MELKMRRVLVVDQGVGVIVAAWKAMWRCVLP